MALHKSFAVPAWKKDLILWTAVFVKESGECAHALNAMLLELRQESPVFVLVALGQELPREIGLPLLDPVQPPYLYAVVKRCCGTFFAGGALHRPPCMQCRLGLP